MTRATERPTRSSPPPTIRRCWSRWRACARSGGARARGSRDRSAARSGTRTGSAARGQPRCSATTAAAPLPRRCALASRASPTPASAASFRARSRRCARRDDGPPARPRDRAPRRVRLRTHSHAAAAAAHASRAHDPSLTAHGTTRETAVARTDSHRAPDPRVPHRPRPRRLPRAVHGGRDARVVPLRGVGALDAPAEDLAGFGVFHRERQLDDERGAPPGSAALGAHLAAVETDELAHDRQAEAEPAVTTRARAVRLPEALEDVR